MTEPLRETRHHFYILDEQGTPVPCDDLALWTKWVHDTQNRIVAKSKIGKADVWTMFRGVNGNTEAGDPLLYETSIAGGAYSGYSKLFKTREEAIAGHDEAVKMVEALQKHLTP